MYSVKGLRVHKIFARMKDDISHIKRNKISWKDGLLLLLPHLLLSIKSSQWKILHCKHCTILASIPHLLNVISSLLYFFGWVSVTFFHFKKWSVFISWKEFIWKGTAHHFYYFHAFTLFCTLNECIHQKRVPSITH